VQKHLFQCIQFECVKANKCLGALYRSGRIFMVTCVKEHWEFCRLTEALYMCECKYTALIIGSPAVNIHSQFPSFTKAPSCKLITCVCQYGALWWIFYYFL
jgi:hypothetical protein